MEVIYLNNQKLFDSRKFQLISIIQVFVSFAKNEEMTVEIFDINRLLNPMIKMIKVFKIYAFSKINDFDFLIY
jgi:hypothetical protein